MRGGTRRSFQESNAPTAHRSRTLHPLTHVSRTNRIQTARHTAIQKSLSAAECICVARMSMERACAILSCSLFGVFRRLGLYAAHFNQQSVRLYLLAAIWIDFQFLFLISTKHIIRFHSVPHKQSICPETHINYQISSPFCCCRLCRFSIFFFSLSIHELTVK